MIKLKDLKIGQIVKVFLKKENREFLGFVILVSDEFVQIQSRSRTLKDINPNSFVGVLKENMGIIDVEQHNLKDLQILISEKTK